MPSPKVIRQQRRVKDISRFSNSPITVSPLWKVIRQRPAALRGAVAGAGCCHTVVRRGDGRSAAAPLTFFPRSFRLRGGCKREDAKYARGEGHKRGRGSLRKRAAPF